MARQVTGAARRVADAAEALRDEKFNARRIELAEAALETLGELGFARTSLREIAQNSEFSHGVLHYYFADKTDLITHCVREYKAVCVTRYDEVVATATTAQELAAGFLDKLAETLTGEADLHRLWYDLRNQSMFEPAFRADLLRRLGRDAEAAEEYVRAEELTDNQAERDFLARRRAALPQMR